MKSLFLGLILSSVFTVKSDAQNVPPSISYEFTSTFPHAGKVNWSSAGKLYKADFLLNEEPRSAFFNNTGDLLALSRYIEFPALPHTLRRALIKQFPDHKIVEMFQIETDMDTDYFVTLERNGISFILKSWQNRKWNLFQNVK